MVPKMDFRELAAAYIATSATFNDDDADALVEMTQLMELTIQLPNVRNAYATNDV